MAENNISAQLNAGMISKAAAKRGEFAGQVAARKAGKTWVSKAGRAAPQARRKVKSRKGAVTKKVGRSVAAKRVAPRTATTSRRASAGSKVTSRKPKMVKKAKKTAKK